MAAGFKIINDSGVIQIDGDYVNSRLIAQGYCDTLGTGTAVTQYWADVALGAAYPSSAECPVVFVRPTQAEKWIGSVAVDTPHDSFGSFPSRPNGSVRIKAQCPFNWAIFSCLGMPVDTGDACGVKVWKADGTLAYSSSHVSPRITQLLSFAGGTSRWPLARSFNQQAAMPWVFASNLVDCSGGENADPVAMMAKVNAGLNTLTVDYLNTNTMLHAAGDPFEGFPAYVGIGALA